jgi:putative hydrolase of the HAD superfamily
MVDRRRVDALFVDLDNTLIDTDRAIGDALIAAFRHVGNEMSDDLATALVQNWWADTAGWYKRYEAGELSVVEQRRGRFLDFAGDLGVDPDLFEEWQRVYVDGAVTLSRLFDDTVAFLDAVAHLPVVIVTNVESPFQQRKIAHLGLADRLPEVVGADLAKRAKPDPALFEIACARAGVAPDRAVHVGDSWDADVVGAQRAGIRAVWLDRDGVGGRNSMPDDVYRVASLAEVPALLR